MSLETRENPATGILEVLVNGEWVRFDDYRRRQIDEAYQNSVRFLRDRLGEDFANEEKNTSSPEGDRELENG
jgi:hypothetical protein